MSKCKYGDPLCPCQDGDVCHYEGKDPMNVAPEHVRNIIVGIDRLTEHVRMLREGISALLNDYRTEGCPDPHCGVCKASKAAEEKAEATLAATDDKPETDEDRTAAALDEVEREFP